MAGSVMDVATGLVEFSRPTAGMFVWMKLLGVEDSFALIREKAVAEKVPHTVCCPV